MTDKFKIPRRRDLDEVALHVLGDGELCAYCGEEAEGNFGIHRDGMGKGPEVPLCDRCGRGERPTLEEIWAYISVIPRRLPDYDYDDE